MNDLKVINSEEASRRKKNLMVKIQVDQEIESANNMNSSGSNNVPG